MTQVAKYLKTTIDTDRVLANLYIAGEVSNFNRASSGHCYFTLKDGESQLRCVKFRDGLGEEHLANGAAVTAHGRITFYPRGGDLQYYVDLVQPEGVGELYMDFLRVRAKLQEEGLFDPSRKRPLPAFPRRIAVITSLSGAVVHDIHNVLSRRYPMVELVLIHTPVQGAQAPQGIIGAFRTAAAEPGLALVILARGGGSLEEMAAFNREDVARAVRACPVPVISAVGHETDVTIADLVADLRAPTPSAAAELATPDATVLHQGIAQFQRRLNESVEQEGLRHRTAVRQYRERLGYLAPDLKNHRQRVDDFVRAAAMALGHTIAALREQVQGRTLQLDSLHPGNTLARGYALVDRAADGQPVAKPSDVKAGDAVNVRMAKGSFQAAVTGKGNHATPRPRRGSKNPVPAVQGDL